MKKKVEEEKEKEKEEEESCYIERQKFIFNHGFYETFLKLLSYACNFLKLLLIFTIKTNLVRHVR